MERYSGRALYGSWRRFFTSQEFGEKVSAKLVEGRDLPQIGLLRGRGRRWQCGWHRPLRLRLQLPLTSQAGLPLATALAALGSAFPEAGFPLPPALEPTAILALQTSADEAGVELLFRLCLGRPPGPNDVTAGRAAQGYPETLNRLLLFEAAFLDPLRAASPPHHASLTEPDPATLKALRRLFLGQSLQRQALLQATTWQEAAYQVFLILFVRESLGSILKGPRHPM